VRGQVLIDDCHVLQAVAASHAAAQHDRIRHELKLQGFRLQPVEHPAM
jgi:hypothetical protein